jgi:hypothetical protein
LAGIITKQFNQFKLIAFIIITDVAVFDKNDKR